MQNDRSTQSKINGAKSSGPTTEAGYQACVNTNMKHGMFSSRVVLDNEDPAIYQALLDSFLTLWHPVDAFEFECVVAMVNARWKFRRLEAAEQAEMNLTMAEYRPEWKAGFFQYDGATEHAIALRHIGPHIHIMIRYMEQQDRTVQRNMNMLAKYRRKTGRSIPTQQETSQAENEVFEKLTKTEEPPEPKQPVPATSASVLTKIATILLLFALLLQTPVKAFTKFAQPTAEASAKQRPRLK